MMAVLRWQAIFSRGGQGKKLFVPANRGELSISDKV